MATILDTEVVSAGTRPTAFTVSAGSNRNAIVMCMTGGGDETTPVQTVTLGGQSMTQIGIEDTLNADVATSFYKLDETGIAAMSGSAFVFSGESSETRTVYIYFSVEDSEQATFTIVESGTTGTSGSESLVRTADSITAVLQGHDTSQNYGTSTNPATTLGTVATNWAYAYAVVTDTDRTASYTWSNSFNRNDSLIIINIGDAGAGGPTVTQTDTTPTDNAIQTINSTGLTVAYTAASVGGASILAGLSNTDPTTATTYTQNNFVTVEGPVSRISEAVDLSVTATGGTATQSITIGPATGLAVVTLTSVDRTTGAPDSNMILEIEATGETVAIGDQFYYETADNTVITAAGVPTSDAVTFDLVLIQGSVTSANGVPFTINTASVTAPTLTLPTSASITKTGATIGCTTNESGGTMYFYISTNSTETAATIKASGETQTVSAIGIQTRALTGLSPSSNYYGHMVQVDSDTEDSNVVNTTQFTTLAVDAPVLAATLALNGTINVSFERTLSQTGGDAATSWTLTGGADQLQYALTNSGVLTRDTANDTEESEVVTVTATNSGGTSNTQTVTITYSTSTVPKTKFRRFPWQAYNKL